MRMCSRCGKVRSRPGQSYCRPCHTAYMRSYRGKRPTKAQLEARITDLEQALDTVLAQLGPGTEAWERGTQVLHANVPRDTPHEPTCQENAHNQ